MHYKCCNDKICQSGLQNHAGDASRLDDRPRNLWSNNLIFNIFLALEVEVPKQPPYLYIILVVMVFVIFIGVCLVLLILKKLKQ